MRAYTKNCISDKRIVATYKIDGVKAIKTKDGWLSRAGKPLHNLPSDAFNGEYEVYLGDFKSSISAVKTHDGKLIEEEHLYMLSPAIDDRLMLGIQNKKDIEQLLEDALKDGYEGLVIRAINSDEWFKLKNVLTFDVEIIDIIEGSGRNVGRLGAFIVKLDEAIFKVGSGLTDINRTMYYTKDMIGKIIEISGMELFKSGKVRHPRFIRIREDLK
jgi:hypothetical protein